MKVKLLLVLGLLFVSTLSFARGPEDTVPTVDPAVMPRCDLSRETISMLQAYAPCLPGYTGAATCPSPSRSHYEAYTANCNTDESISNCVTRHHCTLVTAEGTGAGATPPAAPTPTPTPTPAPTPSPSPAPGADSGSGCSFNPQAVFSFAQLALLAIFPAFLGLRRRLK